jgi:hypothetical protein
MVLLFCLGLNGPRLLPSEAKESNAERPIVSLDAKNQPLRGVLETISKAVGYEITVNEGWANMVLTVRIDGLELENALKRIIAALGNPSYSILTDREKRKTEIRFYADAPVQIEEGAQARTEHLESEAASLDVEVVPPEEPGQGGVTRIEFNRMVAMNKPVDLGTLEVIPPEGPGDKGMTHGELERLLKRNQPVDQRKAEVIPPEGPEVGGLTMAEVNEIIKNQATGALGRGEQFPP